MLSEPGSSHSEPLAKAKDALMEGVLVRATELARQGALDEAAQVLTGHIGLAGAAPATLDLLARVRAQQGAWLEAERRWEHVLSLDPESSAARAGLQRLRQRRPYRPLRAAAVLVLAVLGAAAATSSVLFYQMAEARSADMQLFRDALVTQERSILDRTGLELQQVRADLRLQNVALRDGIVAEYAKRDSVIQSNFATVASQLRRVNVRLERIARSNRARRVKTRSQP